MLVVIIFTKSVSGSNEMILFEKSLRSPSNHF